MFHEYNEFILTKEHTRLLIFLHHSADPDALCAAIALGEMSNQIKKVDYLIYSDKLNQSTKRILKDLDLVIETQIPIVDMQTDFVVTVDIANYSQLGKFQSLVENFEGSKVSVDHHHTNELDKIVDLYIGDEKAGSTCMMITKAYHALGITPSPMISTLLISGHMYDSRRFLHGTTEKTFEMMIFLIQNGGNFIQANEYLQNEMSLSERIARIKAGKRNTYKILDKELLIVTSSIAAFESSVARSLIGTGANIVFVVAKKKNELRASARRSGIDDLSMGDILTQLASEFSDDTYTATGGGHDAAAGLNVVPCPSNKVISKLQDRFVELAEEYYHKNQLSDSLESS
jgi:nanoRNase/pAp phosphatase (c-di-AMP/oligoRNAs hydrolase)